MVGGDAAYAGLLVGAQPWNDDLAVKQSQLETRVAIAHCGVSHLLEGPGRTGKRGECEAHVDLLSI